MLYVGLGNPGSQYSLTRHNVGFMVIDELLKRVQTTKVSSNFLGELYKSEQHFFLKPSTYMNLSGESVVKVVRFYKIPLQEVVVIHDDLDLPFGTLRFKCGGGHGGHNGLKSCDEHITKEYIRVRIGIGKPEHKTEVVSYVLSNFTNQEQEELKKLIPHVADACMKLATTSLVEVASKYSIKKKRV